MVLEAEGTVKWECPHNTMGDKGWMKRAVGGREGINKIKSGIKQRLSSWPADVHTALVR